MKSLKQRIDEDFMDALKNKRREEKTFLGVIKGEIQTKEGRGIESTDESVLEVLRKIEKSLKESIVKGDDSSKVELDLLNKYLPELMSKEDILNIVSKLIEEGKSMPLIMKEFNTTYKGKADNSLVKDLALELIK